MIKHSSLTVSNNDLAAFVQGNANNDGDNDDGDSSDGYEGFLKTFNGDWKQRKIAHWCCRSAIDRRACCATPAADEKNMKRKARQQLQRVLGQLGSQCGGELASMTDVVRWCRSTLPECRNAARGGGHYSPHSPRFLYVLLS